MSLNKIKDKTIYCYVCNKKINLLNFECKCGNNYCINHKMPEKHNCLFNFIEYNKNKLNLENPIIKSTRYTSF